MRSTAMGRPEQHGVLGGTPHKRRPAGDEGVKPDRALVIPEGCVQHRRSESPPGTGHRIRAAQDLAAFEKRGE